ncbi:unnamed protein product [Mytilus coruscus]|uniref:Novel STAND NTPase 3 domain-containing protein n=1 Tax=Mytilus coruscus TaxID=42192 RepID=A0A6J8CYJ6_MYTCO|nr:unnamed protein product [Mytilus coruscus]
MNIKGESLRREVKECKENIDRLSARLNTSEVHVYERIESIDNHLDELQKLQRFLDSQFTRIKNIGIENKKEKEDFVKDVQSLCSHIHVNITKHEERIEKLENKSETLQGIQKDVDILRIKSELIEAEMKKQDEDHIPKNIRAQHGQEIREWEEDQFTFVKTRATHHILESLPLKNCIVVTGSSGCGKSSNIHHAALHLRDSFGYEIIPVLTGPTDIINYYNENKKQAFIVDDICGKETINMQTLQTWRDYSEKLAKIFKNTEMNVESKKDGTVSKVSSPKLLISCRLHIYKEPQFKRIELFTKKECNLLSTKLFLLQPEKMLMLRRYLSDEIIDNVKHFIMADVDFFPLLCKLSKGKTSGEVKKLFTSPLNIIKMSINNITDENKNHLCALVLCILFDDGFSTHWLDSRSAPENTKTKLEDICRE